MDLIWVENFRCFRERQEARLAPLTLLVGENSTGKTSFLAMVRALWDMAYRSREPDFKETPYDLGTFDEIAHHRGARGSRATTFEAGFNALLDQTRNPDTKFEFTFGQNGTTPIPIRKRLSRRGVWLEETSVAGQPYILQTGTPRGAWQIKIEDDVSHLRIALEDIVLPTYFLLLPAKLKDNQERGGVFTPLRGAPPLSLEDYNQLEELAMYPRWIPELRPFASAPVRSKPHRTYDPSRPTPDSEGDYVPMYLADLFSRNKQEWEAIKERLEDFGRISGLFDEISIKRLGNRGSEPFQVQIRKTGAGLKGPRRNLIDMGYGVSQALPVIAELLRKDAPPLFLLQQPEVHLHPSAQAALGSLFCQVANPWRQLLVETHSDHLIDRVRMDVRDGKGSLKPDDVSILYFERQGLDVQIHSLRIDEMGNIMGAPDGYRSFFMEETTRSLGL